MCEVLRENFESQFDIIKSDLKKSAFIAIDGEFSGLYLKDEYQPSLFDSTEDRYKKLRENVEPFLIYQLGLSAFHFDRDKNVYTGKTYVFYLFPRSFSCVDVKFMCQSSSVEFLCQHNFDFNKLNYHGVSYLTEAQTEQIRKAAAEQNLIKVLETALNREDEEVIQGLCSQVALWLGGGIYPNESGESSLLLNIPKESQSSQCLSYIIHARLRKQFVSVWTTSEDGGNVRVQKVTASERILLEQNNILEPDLEEGAFLSLLGFTRIFNILVEIQKPIVGHNLLLDLMLFYKQFYKPLPGSYKEFKANIHKLFPRVFDTKYISTQMKDKLERKDRWENNNLETLYLHFKKVKGGFVIPGAPSVASPFYSKEEGGAFHNAGWDSYTAGYCFIRMAHFFASLACGKIAYSKTLTSVEHITHCKQFSNCVNMVRGNISHFVLDGDDPPTSRPDFIILKSRNKKKLNLVLLTEELSKFGSVDVKLHSNDEAIVATFTRGAYLDISRKYGMHPDYIVKQYSKQHYNFLTWAIPVIVLGGASMFIIYRLSK